MSPPGWDAEAARRAHAGRRAARELAALYARADATWRPWSCPGTAECCQLAARGREPWLWGVEWEALRRASPVLPPARADGGCPFLDPGGRRCTAYGDRPLGCRTYFCDRVQGPATAPSAAMDALLRELEALAQRLDPDERGPRPLTAWHAEARP